jgi:hypothetical protein
MAVDKVQKVSRNLDEPSQAESSRDIVGLLARFESWSYVYDQHLFLNLFGYHNVLSCYVRGAGSFQFDASSSRLIRCGVNCASTVT